METWETLVNRWPASLTHVTDFSDLTKEQQELLVAIYDSDHMLTPEERQVWAPRFALLLSTQLRDW